MDFLLDTNVLSALRVRGRNPGVERTLGAIPLQRQFLCAPTIAEVERGICAKERLDARQGAILRRWFEQDVLPAFDGRILPFDVAAARILAGSPEHVPLHDALIASIASASDMTLVTRNVKHFRPLGVHRLLSPWD